jgi:hypothetical protein
MLVDAPPRLRRNPAALGVVRGTVETIGHAMVVHDSEPLSGQGRPGEDQTPADGIDVAAPHRGRLAEGVLPPPAAVEGDRGCKRFCAVKKIQFLQLSLRNPVDIMPRMRSGCVVKFDLPSGQTVARAMGIMSLSDAELLKALSI